VEEILSLVGVLEVPGYRVCETDAGLGGWAAKLNSPSCVGPVKVKRVFI
jgi:hypothetical protein